MTFLGLRHILIARNYVTKQSQLIVHKEIAPLRSQRHWSGIAAYSLITQQNGTFPESYIINAKCILFFYLIGRPLSRADLQLSLFLVATPQPQTLLKTMNYTNPVSSSWSIPSWLFKISALLPIPSPPLPLEISPHHVKKFNRGICPIIGVGPLPRAIGTTLKVIGGLS